MPFESFTALGLVSNSKGVLAGTVRIMGIATLSLEIATLLWHTSFLGMNREPCRLFAGNGYSMIHPDCMKLEPRV